MNIDGKASTLRIEYIHKDSFDSKNVGSKYCTIIKILAFGFPDKYLGRLLFPVSLSNQKFTWDDFIKFISNHYQFSTAVGFRFSRGAPSPSLKQRGGPRTIINKIEPLQ